MSKTKKAKTRMIKILTKKVLLRKEVLIKGKERKRMPKTTMKMISTVMMTSKITKTWKMTNDF